MPKNATDDRATRKEAALLRDARQFMRLTASLLARFIRLSRTLRRKLERTEAYRRVNGKDDAEREPIWDTAGTFEVMLEDDLDTMVRYLREGARHRPGGRRG